MVTDNMLLQQARRSSPRDRAGLAKFTLASVAACGRWGGSHAFSSAVPEEQREPEKPSSYDHERRLRELQDGSQQRQTTAAAAAGRLPSAAQVAERLRSSGGASCSGRSEPPPAHRKAPPRRAAEPLDWREAVAAARAAQLPVSGAQMLTDTFG